MPINFDLLRKAQDEYSRIEKAELLTRIVERAETEAHAINDFMEWLAPLGIKPDEMSYGADNAYIYSDGLTFTRENNYSEEGFSYRLCITRQATGHSGYVGVFVVDPASWDADWLLRKQSQIMGIIDGLMKEPEPEPSDDALAFDPDEQPVPYVPCWYGAISEIEVTDEEDPHEPVADLPDANDDWDEVEPEPEPARYLGMDDEEYEAALENEPPTELNPPQETYRPEDNPPPIQIDIERW
jgi:hypothetical protein